MLQIRDLTVQIGPHEIIYIDALDLAAGERLGLVGESGSGKTMIAMSIVGLLPTDAVVTGSIRFRGRELVELSDAELAKLRGIEIGVVFQDPTRALNPMMRIGRQVSEVLRIHTDLGRDQMRGRVIELLGQVQLSDPEPLLRRYPHQLSGGQQQRVLIAMAIASDPQLLIADEPTTALDVTVQEGILNLLVELSHARDMGLLFVSHDLGVVRSVSERLAVVYGGHLVESGPIDEVIGNSKHRYTEALISANPGLAAAGDLPKFLGKRLKTVFGSVPPLGAFPEGCRFRGRCPHEIDACSQPPPITRVEESHIYKCWNPAEGDVDAAVG